MAVTVDWANSDIQVAYGDTDVLTQIQVTPTEIWRLDTNAFRIELRELEESPEGRPNPVTHNHNEDVNVGGVNLADVLIIREPYTITFEDGQYAVYLQGTNNNILEKTNKNQVSVNPSNSAGLVTSSEIQYSVYSGGITIDVVEGNLNARYPSGTPFQPTNSIDNAIIIRNAQRLPSILYVRGNLDITAAVPSLKDFTFIGEGKDRTHIDLDSVADVEDCTYFDAYVTGTLDGNSRLSSCVIDNLNYIKGYIESCVLSAGEITLAGTEEAHFLDCYSGVPGEVTPVINMGGSGQALAMRGYNGGITLRNKTGTDKVSIDLASGQVVLENTVSNGLVVCRGEGKLVDESGDHIPSGTWNGVTIVNETSGYKFYVIEQLLAMVPGDVWDEAQADHTDVGSMGEAISDLLSAGGSLTPQQATWLESIFNSTDKKLLTKALWLALK